jgi:uncharacterized delta-60 repeat protein
MKKITLILIFISTICIGQTYTIDNNFNPSDTGIYSQIVGGDGVILNDGKILTIKGIGWGYADIYRLNTDGSKDTSFTELNLPYSIDRFFANSIQGNFITAKGTSNSDNTTLQCYDSNGLVVTSFSTPIFTKTVPFAPNTFSGSNINKIYFLNDGKFLIFGDFNYVNNVSYNGIVKLNANGSIDTGFNIGTGFSGSTSAFAIQANGKYLVGGDFTSYNGVLKGKMVRLETNGTLDATFNVYTQYSSSGASYGYGSGKIQDIVIQPDGKIITSGPDLYSNGGRFRNDIVRLNTNGSVDTSFRFYENYADLPVSKLQYNSDGSIFFEMGGRIKNVLIRES